MDHIETDNAIASLSKSIEELTYRIFTLEDSIANINAYIEEHKEESIDG